MRSLAPSDLNHGLELLGGGRAFADQVGSILVDTPLFEALTAAEIQAIAPSFQLYRMSEGAWIFRESDPGSFLCVMASGRVDIVKNTTGLQTTRIAVERNGRCFGEMALIDGEPRSASALCVEAGTLLVLPRLAFDQLMEKQSVLALKLLRRITVQLSQNLRRATGMVVARFRDE